MKAYTSMRKIFISICVFVSAAGLLGAGTAFAQPAFAIVDDFDNADSATNFLGLQTAAGNFGAGDMVADYDIYGSNPYNTLNTAHQISWDGALGNSPGPDNAFWYSFVNDGTGPVIPIRDFSHLSLKLQTVPVVSCDSQIMNKVDVIGIDLQVNYPEGETDQEGKPFRIYRAYQPVVEWNALDFITIDFKDFCDEFNPAVRFIDNLTYNSENLRAVAITMTDPTDNYLMATNGDGSDTTLDNKGTLFVEDVAFWSKANSIISELRIDDFEDTNTGTNLLGYSTGSMEGVISTEENYDSSKRCKIQWTGQEQRWRSDVSNGGANPLDISDYTHLAFDIISDEADMGDIYMVGIYADSPGPITPREYWYRKGANGKRVEEVYIPLYLFEDEYNRPILGDDVLSRIQEIRFIFGHTEKHRTIILPIGDNNTGTVRIDNLRFVKIQYGPLYNYPPVISEIDGQDTTNDFIPDNVFERKTYSKNILAGQPVSFQVKAGDYNGSIGSLNADLSTLSSATFEATLNGPDAAGTFSWTPQLADVGNHTVKFTVIDDKGAKDIQQFDIIVSEPPPPAPVAGFTASPTSGTLPLTVQFTDTSTGSIAGWSWTFWDATNQRFLTGSTQQNPVLTITQHGLIYARLTVTGPGGSDIAPDIRISAEVGTIRGTLTDASTGIVLPNANIQVWRFSYPDIDYKLYAQTTTSQNGYYEFNNLSSVFHHNSLQTDHYKIKVAGQTEYEDYESSEIVFYQSGTWLPDIVQHNVALVQKGNYIKGKVYNSVTGTPIAGATITIKPHAYGYGTHDYTATTDANGNYIVSDLIKSVSSSGGAVTWIRYKVYVSVNGYDDFVSEEAVYSATSCHFVRDAALIVPPVASFTATPTSGLTPLIVRFTSTSTGSITQYTWFFKEVTLTGEVSLPESGTHEVNPVITITEPKYVKVVLRVDGPNGHYSIEPDTNDPVFYISTIRGQIKGVVTNAAYSNVLPNMQVELWSAYPSYTSPLEYKLDRTATTSANGSYVFDNVTAAFYAHPPGGGPYSVVRPVHYIVKIAEQGWFNSYESGDILFHDGTNWANQIQVNNVALTQRENYIKGKVYNSVTGTPIAGALVTIKPHAYGYGTHDYTATTDANGDYKVNDLIGHTQSSGGTVTWIRYKVYVSVNGYDDFVSEEAAYSATECQFVRDAALMALPPVADFHYTTTGGPAPVVTFNNLSTGDITNYLWNFGDNTTSTEQNPVHAYNKVGHYLVSLTATGPGGSDVRIGVACSGVPAALRGTVTDAVTGAGLTGVTVLLKCPPNTLPGIDYTAVTDANGFYFIENIERRISNSSGGAPINYEIQVSLAGYNDYSKQNINYNTAEDITNDIALTPIPAPVANFRTNAGCGGDVPFGVIFTDQSTGQIDSWLWDFGNGITSTQKLSVLYIYQTPGTYTVSLTVTGPGGSNTKTLIDEVKVYPAGGILSGKIIDAVTGSPLAGADIVLKPFVYNYPTPEYSTVTDENGNYEITRIQKRVSTSGGSTWIPYTLYVSKEGYADYVSGRMGFYYGVEGTKVLDITLTPIPVNASAIQDAINAASAGDTIILPSGTYTLASQLNITKNIILKAIHPDKTVLVLGNNSILIKGASDLTDVTLENLTITGYAGVNPKGPIESYASNLLTLKNCKLVGNKGTRVSGICYEGTYKIGTDGKVYKTGGLKLDNTLIAGNTTEEGHGYDGPYFPSGTDSEGKIIYWSSRSVIRANGGKLEIINSTIADNINNSSPTKKVKYAAIFLDTANLNTMANTIMWNNGLDKDDIYVYRSGLITNITYSDIDSWTLDGCPKIPGEGSICEDPDFLDPEQGDYTPQNEDCSSMGARFNQLTQSAVLQSTIDSAKAGSSIILFPDTYSLTTQLKITKNITIKGTDPNKTILLLGNNNILVKDSLYMAQNEAYYQLYDNLTNVILENLTITGYIGTNSKGPIEAYVRNYLILKNCKLVGNKGTSVSGIYYGGTYLWTDATKTALWKTGGVKLINTLVAGNTTEEGHGYDGPYFPAITTEGTTAYHSGRGVIYGNGGKLEVYNSTIAGNLNNSSPTRKVKYGAMFLKTARLTMENSIMWNNGLDRNDVYLYGSGKVGGATYSDVEQESITGTSVINEDPLFSEGTYTISDISPCKGRGLNGADMGAAF